MSALRLQPIHCAVATLWVVGLLVPAQATAADKGWLPIVVQTPKPPASANVVKPRGAEPDTFATQAQLDALTRAKTPKEQLEALARATAPRAKAANAGAKPKTVTAQPKPVRNANPHVNPLNAGLIASFANTSAPKAAPAPSGSAQPIQPANSAVPRAKALPAHSAEPTPTEINLAVRGSEVPDVLPADTGNIVTGAVDNVEGTRHLAPEDAARLSAVPAHQQPRVEGTGAVPVPDSDLARRYCISVADTAADARIAWQKAKLAETEQEIGKRIAALEAKTAEYKAWVERRDEFSRRANETLLKIYGRMEPDAAAQQLGAMDEETAAAILAKLDSRSTSAILNEMQPEKAARLTATIAGAARAANAPPVPRAGAAAQAAAQGANGQPPYPGNGPQYANQGGRRQ